MRLPDPAVRGSVLILVTWTTLMLGMLAVGLGIQSAASLDRVQRLTRERQALGIAQAGVQHAIMMLNEDQLTSTDGLSETWVNRDDLFKDRLFDGGVYTVSQTTTLTGAPETVYGLVDAERRLNLNTATEPILTRLLERQGLRSVDAQALAQAILDWRDEDHDPRSYGAENFYYLGISPSYECKDAPFEQPEELLLVKGVTPSLYRRLAPLVTTMGAGWVNLNTAETEVLAVLGLSEAGVNGLNAYRAGEDMQLGTSDDRMVYDVSSIGGELAEWLPAEDLSRLTRLAAQDLIGVSSKAFAVSVQARLEDTDVAVQVSAMVDREGRLLSWGAY